jgi:hypothetical protein
MLDETNTERQLIGSNIDDGVVIGLADALFSKNVIQFIGLDLREMRCSFQINNIRYTSSDSSNEIGAHRTNPRTVRTKENTKLAREQLFGQQPPVI